MKLGLALSGGGFRAAFFHVGILAQMAMLGLLRHVEVISTVSGGSIIGALYYLHVKRLLEEHADNAITDEMYLNEVIKIEEEFLKAVQCNIRMRTFSNPLKNIKMVLPNYSRSDRIGELYDELIYRPAFDAARSAPIRMRELKVSPKDPKKNAIENFYPRTDNFTRKAKVPILLINATTLNTGHNWRFTASSMGEPPRKGSIVEDIDKNLRLRRPPSYDDIIRKQQDIELGLAVAASACVPGLFHPLAITDLYPDDIRVQLVDGGVHDNQGIQGLLDEECTHFIISDAAGQLTDEPDPMTQIPAVLSRSNDILMERVREEELCRLLEDKPVAFMHLRKGLDAKAICWNGPDGKPAVATKFKKERTPKTSSEAFGVSPKVQERLSWIRTDLDSFTEVEAFSLMLDAYKMSAVELSNSKEIKGLIKPIPHQPTNPWAFSNGRIENEMSRPSELYLRQLEVAKERLFKIFRLSLPVTIVTLFIILVIVGGLGYLLWDKIIALLSYPMTVGQLGLAVFFLALGFVPKLIRILQVLRFFRSPMEFLVRFVVRGLLPAMGSVFVLLHLLIFDCLFLSYGKVENLTKPPSR